MDWDRVALKLSELGMQQTALSQAAHEVGKESAASVFATASLVAQLLAVALEEGAAA